MSDLLLWLYVINAVLLIDHEIDSAYWKEWELFRLPGGITGFLLLHIPLLFVILWGLILIVKQSYWGSVLSLLLCLGGFFAFAAHTYLLRKGRPQFNNPISKCILVAILLVSVIQAAVTLYGIGQ
ncbi:MAG: DUF6713 family protein [Pseudomonadota bacterium]